MVKSFASEVFGSWLSFDAQMRLPNVRRAFDQNRDPMIAAQMKDMEKTESERRRVVASDQTESDSGSGGLAAQRDAAFQSHKRFRHSNPASEQNNGPAYKPRHAPRYSGPSL